MLSRRRLGIGGIVVGLVFSTVTTATADQGAPAPPPAGTEHTVTLVTGDRVTVIDGRAKAVRPAAGREGITFSARTMDGHTHVVPADAQRLVDGGRVDPRLFDITTLLEFGYTDRMPLIVTGDALPAVRSARTLPAVDGMAVEADAAGALWGELTSVRSASGVSKVWLDGKRKASLDRSVTQIGAPTAWEAGYTGEGITVAVLDTGVDQTHLDLADREIAEQNFTDSPDTVDRNGHGTHVASILAGTGARSGGRYRGVASGASILDGKVLDDWGSGTDSTIIAGMQWAVDQGADVVNMSIGGDDYPGIDPMEEAVNTLSAEHGTLFVIAAGNQGFPGGVSSPGSAEAALTVGAVDRNDQLADFSSQGPRIGDAGLKPDLTAPGVDIVAALHTDGTIGEPVEPGYTALSGTSMAAPHVAGAAALLAQQHPDWTGARLKAALTGSAAPNADLGEYAQGAGRVDLARAIEQTVVSEPTNVSFGIATWPHGDEPVTKSFSYRNLSATDVTLSLRLDTDAPEGMFTLGTTEITVPAGGTSEVDVTTTTRSGTELGSFGGTVVATAGDSAGDTIVRTPVGVVLEEERYGITVRYLDENGEPATDNRTQVFGQSAYYELAGSDADGTAELRVPKGRYLLDHTVVGTDGRRHMLFQPNVEVTGDITVTVDARVAKPIDITPPAGASWLLGDIGFQLDANFAYASGILSFTPLPVSTAQIGPPPPDGDVITGWVSTYWGDAADTLYGLTWFSPEFPTGRTEVVEPSELATVRTDVAAQGAGRTAERMVTAVPPSGSAQVFGIGLEFALPHSLVEKVTTDGVRWHTRTRQLNGWDEEVTYRAGSAYRAGKTYDVRLNHGMFGPSLRDNGYPGGPVFRENDVLFFGVPLFSDSDGHAGESVITSGVTRLYSGTELLAEIPGVGIFSGVPHEEREYRVTMEATRGAPFDLGTEISGEWTFTSGPTAPDVREPQDVSVVRFHPRLDAEGAAPAGRPFAVPVLLQRNGGDTVRARGIEVEASYDEGRTWTRVPVLLDTVALLNHPADAKTVSLRAFARDSDGDTVKQTIIRAYHLK